MERASSRSRATHPHGASEPHKLKRISSFWGKPYLHTVSLEPGEDLVHSLLVTNPIHQFISSGVLGGAVSVI